MPQKSWIQVLNEARGTLGVHTDVDFAKFLGVSRRTVQRHRSEEGFPDGNSKARFVRTLFTRDPASARVLAEVYRVNLSDLEPKPAPSQATKAPAVGREQVAVLTLAASDALNMLPRDVRPLLATIFGEAIALGVDLNQLAPLLVQKKTVSAKS